MKNVVELRKELVSVFTDLKNEKIEPKRAHELSNAAGKIIGTVGLQLKYAAQRNEVPRIEFLNDESAQAETEE